MLLALHPTNQFLLWILMDTRSWCCDISYSRGVKHEIRNLSNEELLQIILYGHDKLSYQ